MTVRLLVLAFFALLVGHGLAAELAPELQTVIDGFAAHRRVAIGYLRTDNPELAAIEIERMRDRWHKDRRDIPPGVADDPALFKVLAATEQGILDSLAAANKGELAAAQRLLEDAAERLRAWRKANGIRLFSDCIAEAGAVYERLDAYRLRPPDLAIRETREAVDAEMAATEAAFRRCDEGAPAVVRANPEFRRVIDGMLNSLRQVPEALRQRDSGLLHRLLIEQRAFDRLLAFRFG